jgi:hypothetical protein
MGCDHAEINILFALQVAAQLLAANYKKPCENILMPMPSANWRKKISKKSQIIGQRMRRSLSKTHLCRHWLHSIFGVFDIPCDSQMRTTRHPLELSSLRAPCCSLISQLQRGKGFEKMTCLYDHYLLSGDGTDFYYSDNVNSEKFLVKKRKNGTKSYYQQMHAAAFVHPSQAEIIPV